MRYFPAFLDLAGRPGLVVGGGEAAARKVRLLRKAGARVTVVAPRLEAELEALIAGGEVAAVRRGFVAGDLRGAAVVHAATGEAETDARVAEAARAAGVPINVVDRPELSSFVMPAIVDRDPVVVGISTGGAAPVLARRIREAVEALLPARLGELARFAEGFRRAVAARLPTGAARLRFWEGFFDGPVAAAVLAGEAGRARAGMLRLVNREGASGGPQGSVAIVGAGPGDPDLLTLKALRALQRAELVVYDRLVPAAIVDLARRDAERLDVGKAPGRHAYGQDEINALLVAAARAGKRVVRLKGGDPFVFGRGGEELEHLRAHNVAAEVVPGITAATGCAAAAGIPLTHREHAGAVTFVAGQGRDGAPEPDWASLARAERTLVVYMGLATAERTAERLIAHGLDPQTPAAVVEKGTLPGQRVIATTLAGLPARLAAEGVEGPALIVIGRVAALAEAGAAALPAALAV